MRSFLIGLVAGVVLVPLVFVAALSEAEAANEGVPQRDIAAIQFPQTVNFDGKFPAMHFIAPLSDAGIGIRNHATVK